MIDQIIYRLYGLTPEEIQTHGGRDVNYELTQHARDVLEERHIPVEWLERTLREPELKHPDPADATLERRYRKIPERENRVLRVVVNTTLAPIRVVSVYFDRTMKGEL